MLFQKFLTFMISKNWVQVLKCVANGFGYSSG